MTRLGLWRLFLTRFDSSERVVSKTQKLKEADLLAYASNGQYLECSILSYYRFLGLDNT